MAVSSPKISSATLCLLSLADPSVKALSQPNTSWKPQNERELTDDKTTPSSCTLEIGNTNPATGKPITNPDIFMEYYRLAYHQIYIQNKEENDLLYMDGILNDDGENKTEKNSSACRRAIPLRRHRRRSSACAGWQRT